MICQRLLSSIAYARNNAFHAKTILYSLLSCIRIYTSILIGTLIYTFVFTIQVKHLIVSLSIDIRMLRMFERIISIPIFLQLPVFGIILAILLYQIEHVRFILKFETNCFIEISFVERKINLNRNLFSFS